jgi:hypothetical protein
MLSLTATPKASNPRTPIVKRFLRDVLKPSVALGKRQRDTDQEKILPVASTETPNCVALQNEDDDKDAVIITALNSIPFCCHADLLIMSRVELIQTATTMNAKLPKVLQIDVSGSRTNNFIRHSIELLVGIRTDALPASKRSRSLSLNTFDFDATYECSSSNASTFLPFSPISPFAYCHRSNILRDPPVDPGMLDSLQERDEDSLGPNRPSKRGRTGVTTLSATPTRLTGPVVSSHPDRSSFMDVLSCATDLQERCLLRSPEERGPLPHISGLHRNISVARGPGSRRHGRSQSALVTSTPKARRLVPRGTRSQQDPVKDSSFSSPLIISAATTTSEYSPDRSEYVSRRLDSSITQQDQCVHKPAADVTSISLSSTSCSDMDISK